MPKIIEYDAAGKPTNEQDTALKVKTGTTEIIDWATWAQTTAVAQHYEKLGSKLACASALLRIHMGTPTAAVPIKMVKEKGKTKCVALEDLEIGRLKLPLTIWKEESLQDESKHPHRVRVTYKVQRNASSTTASECVGQVSFVVAPELSLPKWTPEVSGEGVYHDWKLHNTAHLFWAIRRWHAEDTWNCEYEMATANDVLVVGFNARKTILDNATVRHIASVAFPVLTNTRKIKKDDEVVLEVAEPPPVPKNAVVRTWVNDIKRTPAEEASDSSNSKKPRAQ